MENWSNFRWNKITLWIRAIRAFDVKLKDFRKPHRILTFQSFDVSELKAGKISSIIKLINRLIYSTIRILNNFSFTSSSFSSSSFLLSCLRIFFRMAGNLLYERREKEKKKFKIVLLIIFIITFMLCELWIYGSWCCRHQNVDVERERSSDNSTVVEGIHHLGISCVQLIKIIFHKLPATNF